MDKNANRTACVNAIWENPDRIFGCRFNDKGKYKANAERTDEYDEVGKIRLSWNKSHDNLNVYYNGSSRNGGDVFTYIRDYIFPMSSNFGDLLRNIADRYGINLNFSKDELTQISRAKLARTVVPVLVEALQKNPTGDVAAYIKNGRGLNIDNHFGELSTESLAAVREYLKQQGIKVGKEKTNRNGREYMVDELELLGLSEYNINNGFRCVMPYYTDGHCTGFVLRNINPTAAGKDRYRYSSDSGRPGFCDRLTDGRPVCLCEGQFDAIALIQAGITNVVAFGGSEPGDEIFDMIRRHDIHDMKYIRDVEYKAGTEQTELVQNVIKKYKQFNCDSGDKVLDLSVISLQTTGHDLSGDFKMDAADYNRQNGAMMLKATAQQPGEPWFIWELHRLIDETGEEFRQFGTMSRGAFQYKFDKIFKAADARDRELIKQALKNDEKIGNDFEMFGISRQSLTELDSIRRREERRAKYDTLTAELTKAIKTNNAAHVVELSAQLAGLNDNTQRDEWDKQIYMSDTDELCEIIRQPERIKTKWELGVVAPGGKFIHYEDIEFWPADITVFCASTSHGKTAILFQSALDLVTKAENKVYLYISCEENHRQLYERALNVFIDIDVTEDGKGKNDSYCFKTGTRKRAIEQAIKDAADMYNYAPEHWAELKRKIRTEVDRYNKQIKPHLLLIHTEDTAESIAENVKHYVDLFRDENVEVGGVFVDYMQLLTSDVPTYSRHDELKGVCKCLKSLAAQTELPIIIAAQLNREAIKTGIDDVTVANIGEAADIERIAHDIYFVWQTDKTKLDTYYSTNPNTNRKDWSHLKERALRILKTDAKEGKTLKTGYLYVEQIKARDGRTGGWGLLTFNGERGRIGENDKLEMITK